ncbi:hypothetical protein C2S53_006602 [Perilla frutescens var. hirtella]|uniref:TTF-type domain-containing protein n=1 Tax=Perilla frutescens var. hirtella TaxID=608512 RepID=A0AAD4J7W7_PERFH|nr:hypothetical protein C2S53_006602 [Perilla frutescens var. hirtella]
MEEEDRNLAAQLQQEEIQRSRSQSQQFNVNDLDTQENETPEVEMPMPPHSGQAPQFTYQPSGMDREMPHISEEASKKKVISDIFLIHFKKIPVPKQNEHDEQKFIAKCNYCGKEYPHRIGGGYGTFKKHLKVHPVEMGLARGQTQMVNPSINLVEESSPTEVQNLNQDSNSFHIERDPGLRMSIWSYAVDKRDEIRRAYLMMGPYQGIPNISSKYVNKNGRKFLPAWYKKFPDWLEYSPTKNVAYCLPCFLFVKPSAHPWANAFNVDGFQNWKKRHDQLQSAQAIQIEELCSTNELETGRGKNQIGIVQRPGDTRWGSHLRSLHSVRNMFKSIVLVLEVMLNEKHNLSFKATVDGAYDMMTSFEFVFILHFMIELLEVTDDLFINTKELIRRYRESGYDKLLDEVKGFCDKYEIEIPDMNGPCCSGRGRVTKVNSITLDHHYRFDIFTETTDLILQEMKNRFNDDAIELLKLSSVLDPRDGYKSFSIDNICELMEKFYPDDFTSQEKFHMKLFRLILTLPVSTATTERAFSSMKIVKTRLRNKMEDDFLASSLLMYIEKEIAEKIDVESIIDEFDEIPSSVPEQENDWSALMNEDDDFDNMNSDENAE